MSVFAPDLLAGRTAVVTGGGTGIGRATALELASLGCRVAVVGRRMELLEQTAAAATAGIVRPYVADVREPDQVDEVLDRVGSDLGGADTLVNNAGGQFVSPAEAISRNGFRAVTRLNLDAVWNLTTAAANRWMIPAGFGKVVSVVISPRRAMPGMAHSAAARAGVEAMTRTLAVEWGPKGIRLNCVAPGYIHTDAFERYGLSPEFVGGSVPARRLGTPEDVAAAITFLVSPAGDYITGDTLLVDGGLDTTTPSAGWQLPG